MIFPLLAVLCGLLLLLWSAERFVEGAAETARYFGMPPLLIGMVIVGFGTSAPEMIVSAFAALQGNPGIALGNAYGSNITNIGLILGLTAMISPIAVHSRVLHKELPLLALVTGLAAFQLADGALSRSDAWVLLLFFALLMGWSILQGVRDKDSLGEEVEHELADRRVTPARSLFRLLSGLVVLIGSSRLLVWGAVDMARAFGVGDLIIGLTIVAVGTSLPELASSLMATRKGEHDIALGNVLGSNLFNTLAVVGIAGAIHPLAVESVVMSRDMVTMGMLTLALFVAGYGFAGRQGRINRLEGLVLVAAYIGYNLYLVKTVFIASA